MPRPVIGLGAGGHAKVVIDILRHCRDVEIIGLLDPRDDLQGQSILGIPVIGTDDQLPVLFAQGVREVFNGVGGLTDPAIRARLFHDARRAGFDVRSAIHPSALLSPSGSFGIGLTAMPGAVVNAGAVLGDNILLNTGAIVEHDCRVGDHGLIGPGAILAGNVTVEAGALIGMGALVREGVRIGRQARVGAGSLVLHDVPDQATVVGVPAH
jgi:UDP-perosamine 4-acetyltransferase